MTVYLEFNGKPVPARDCSWLLVSPCGCVSGIMVAELHDRVITSPEQAMAEFEPTAEQRRRDVAAGFNCRLSGAGRSAVSELRNPEQCPHTPKWGVEPTLELEGHTWAAESLSGRRMRTQHLVPNLGLEQYQEGKFGAPHVPALCGAETFFWSDKWHALDGRPTCRRCESLARKAVATA